MTKASKLFKHGRFTAADIRIQPDGSRIITIMLRNGRSAKFKVKKLYEPDEEIIEDEEVEEDEPQS